MQSNPFLNFQRTAEAHGYPALLIVSAACLGLVVAAVALLALTQAGWVLALALLSLIAAVAVLAGAIDAALSDYDAPAAAQTGVGAAARDEGDPVAARPRRQRPAGHVGHGRKAA